MNRNIQFLFVQRNHRIINLMQIFADFQKDIRVKVIDSYREPNNMFLKQLQIIHYSHKINSICNLPFKRIWGYPINDIKCKDDTQYYVIFTNASLFPMSPSYLMKIKKQYKLKYILYCIDTRNTSGFQDAEPYLQQMKFDYILTFDYSDSKRYGYLYYKLPYSKLPIKPCETTKDLYYVGSCKKGLTSLHELYHRERKKAVLELYKNVYIYPKFPFWGNILYVCALQKQGRTCMNVSIYSRYSTPYRGEFLK